MQAEFKIVDENEEEILHVLDDDIFLGHIKKEDLYDIADIEPCMPVDQVVHAALQRALRLSIPDGISGTMNRKGMKAR